MAKVETPVCRTPSAHRRVSVTVTGRVQGVGFRAATRDKALALGLAGWARNRPDGSVELLAEGPGAAVAAFLLWCQSGPSLARVDDCYVTEGEPGGRLTGFRILG